jgi:hypothetical protein
MVTLSTFVKAGQTAMAAPVPRLGVAFRRAGHVDKRQ